LGTLHEVTTTVFEYVGLTFHALRAIGQNLLVTYLVVQLFAEPEGYLLTGTWLMGFRLTMSAGFKTTLTKDFVPDGLFTIKYVVAICLLFYELGDLNLMRKLKVFY